MAIVQARQNPASTASFTFHIPPSAFRPRSIYSDNKHLQSPIFNLTFPMQTYDLLMLLVLVAATLFGFWKGMAWQVASLASLVVSYFAALRFADQVAPMISDHAPWNKFVAMLAIYIGTSFVIWTLFRLVSGLIDSVKMDGFDHQMGALIGFAKGVLLTIAITFFAVTILPQSQGDMIVASRTGEYIVRFLDKTNSVVPPEIHEVIHPYVERIEQRLDPNRQPQPGPGGFPIPWPGQQQAPTAPSTAPTWPAQVGTPNDRPGQQNPSSVYDPPTWPQDQQPIPAWPSQPQTAGQPTGAPL